MRRGHVTLGCDYTGPCGRRRAPRCCSQQLAERTFCGRNAAGGRHARQALHSRARVCICLCSGWGFLRRSHHSSTSRRRAAASAARERLSQHRVPVVLREALLPALRCRCSAGRRCSGGWRFRAGLTARSGRRCVAGPGVAVVALRAVGWRCACPLDRCVCSGARRRIRRHFCTPSIERQPLQSVKVFARRATSAQSVRLRQLATLSMRVMQV